MEKTEITEAFKRAVQAELNATAANRIKLESKYGQCWNTEELQKDFEILGFKAPYVIVERKSDGIKGSLEFQHQPRFYFSWRNEITNIRKEG